MKVIGGERKRTRRGEDRGGRGYRKEKGKEMKERDEKEAEVFSESEHATV